MGRQGRLKALSDKEAEADSKVDAYEKKAD